MLCDTFYLSTLELEGVPSVALCKMPYLFSRCVVEQNSYLLRCGRGIIILPEWDILGSNAQTLTQLADSPSSRHVKDADGVFQARH